MTSTQPVAMRGAYACMCFIVAVLSAFSIISLGWGASDTATEAYNRGDYATAHREYLSEAQKGSAWATMMLGELYYYGLGVPQDYLEAVKWYREAVDRGLYMAEAKLGHMYELGLGVQQDYVLAHQWFNLAAAQLPPGVMQIREEAVSGRDRVAAKMTPAQIAEAQRMAREWKLP